MKKFNWKRVLTVGLVLLLVVAMIVPLFGTFASL